MPPKKFRSQKRKKRKGFHGKKAWEISQEQQVLGEETTKRESSTASRHLERSTEQPSCSTTPQSSQLPARNISAEKLVNSSFTSLEEEECHLTRSKARKLGLTKDANVSEAHGLKLQDTSLLSECISQAAICSSCRLPNSKLQLYQDNN